MILEVIAISVEDAINAQSGGADRIELISNFKLGGTTPSIKLVKKVLEKVKIKIRVMIRPRGGNFIYTEDEILEMSENIKEVSQTKAEGIVIGILDKNKQIDEINLKRLLSQRKRPGVTFHMAFDEIIKKEKAINVLFNLNVDRILTSGGQGSIKERIRNIKKTNELAKGKIIVMAGQGIDKNNVEKIVNESQIKEIHCGRGVRTNNIVDSKKVYEIRKILDSLRFPF